MGDVLIGLSQSLERLFVQCYSLFKSYLAFLRFCFSTTECPTKVLNMLSRTQPPPCGSGKKFKKCCHHKQFSFEENGDGGFDRIVPMDEDESSLLSKHIDSLGPNVFTDTPGPIGPVLCLVRDNGPRLHPLHLNSVDFVAFSLFSSEELGCFLVADDLFRFGIPFDHAVESSGYR